MKIAIIGNEKTTTYLQSLSDSINWISVNNINDWNNIDDVDGFFNLDENSSSDNYHSFTKPVFINSVVHSLQSKQHGPNVVRINAWHGFLERGIWEIAGNLQESHTEILKALNKNYTLLPDEAGFIAPRILAMIINEAYFAKEQQVSTETEIDTAMKLGTNYPKGPFEWKNEIGLHNILALLEALCKTDKRYQPSELLSKEAAIL